MTKERLSKLYYIREEIQMWERKLHELDLEAQGEAVKISGMPFTVGGTSDKTGEIATQKVDIRAKIEKKKIALEHEYKILMDYIMAIDDSYVRQIMYHRHVELQTWYEVAKNVGGSAESVRKIHDRYLE